LRHAATSKAIKSRFAPLFDSFHTLSLGRRDLDLPGDTFEFAIVSFRLDEIHVRLKQENQQRPIALNYVLVFPTQILMAPARRPLMSALMRPLKRKFSFNAAGTLARSSIEMDATASGRSIPMLRTSVIALAAAAVLTVGLTVDASARSGGGGGGGGHMGGGGHIGGGHIGGGFGGGRIGGYGGGGLGGLHMNSGLGGLHMDAGVGRGLGPTHVAGAHNHFHHGRHFGFGYGPDYYDFDTDGCGYGYPYYNPYYNPYDYDCGLLGY
jgi:hypothetical protein